MKMKTNGRKGVYPIRRADFQARIKKIEIANKVLADGWSQTIRVQLDEIGLTNENLLELRQFRPNEPVSVIIEPVEPTLFDVTPRPARDRAADSVSSQEEEVKDFVTLTEDDGVAGEPAGKVVREFKVCKSVLEE